MTYIGRFAPTPSGPLHLGSLIAATASYLDAKSHQGLWLLRIDDLDTPRVVTSSFEQIFRQLEAYGFEWDGEPLFQSKRTSQYQDALERLLSKNDAFYCQCTRKQIFERHAQGIYNGHCRGKKPNNTQDCSVRFVVPNSIIEFEDLIQGHVSLNPQKDLGDFIIKRRDGFFGYHLACALDDLEQGVTHVIRGHDLLSSSFAQRLITFALERRFLQYGHHPVVVNQDQIKYSKSAKSDALPTDTPVPLLWQALKFLGQEPPQALQKATLVEVWDWALKNWQRTAIPNRDCIEL